VAVGAVNDGLAMGLGMAGIALGHYLIPIVLFRIVAMEGSMALLAFEAVLAAIGLQIAEDLLVALGALGRSQRGRRRSVHFLIYRDLHRGNLLSFRGGKGCGSNKQHNHRQHYIDPVHSHVVFPPVVYLNSISPEILGSINTSSRNPLSTRKTTIR